MESVVPGPTRNGSPLLVVVGVGAQPLSLPSPAHLTAPGADACLISPRPLGFQPRICSDIRWGLSPALACQ